jgi:16S rRNA (uracil1498-N3)-methyltransferase
MRRRFFVERFEGDRAVLAGEPAGHLERVLRARPGQVFELSDGVSVRLGEVQRVEHERIEFGLQEEVPSAEPAFSIQLLLALVKFDHFEWELEKASELGVAEIVPLEAARSEPGFSEAARKRAARWEKILYGAAQQSRQLRPPVLRKLAKPAAAFAAASGARRILLSENAAARFLKEVLAPGEGAGSKGGVSEGVRVSLAVGPEGGWTKAELDAAASSEFEEASLGQGILRTETAVIAGLACLRYALGDSG